MASEKLNVPSGVPATDQSIQEFSKQSMQGERFQDGSRFDTETRGFGSGVSRGEARSYDPADAPAAPKEQDFVPPVAPAPVEDDIDHWKRLYGQSENEKGELRQNMQSEIAQMRNELAGMRAAIPQQYNQPAATGQYQPVQQPTQAAQLPETFFPNRGENDIVEIKDVDEMLKTLVAPAVMQLNQQQQALQAQAAQQAKAAAGITPSIEQKLAAECPWITQVPDGQARIEAMRGIMQTRPSQGLPAQPQSVQVSPEQAAARRVTYVESGKAVTSSEGEVPIQQQIAQEYGAARNLAEKKAVLIKHGMQHVNDWGPDAWGPVR